jgi:hypothetical protein
MANKLGRIQANAYRFMSSPLSLAGLRLGKPRATKFSTAPDSDSVGASALNKR